MGPVSAAVLVLLVLVPAVATAHGGAHPPPDGPASSEAKVADEGAPRLGYELPTAGSYELPPILRVDDHALLGSDGERAKILALAPGQLAVVSFVYLGCRDPAGCPLALATLVRLDRALAARADLSPHVRLVSVSFDPRHDRPADLARLREGLTPRADWRFFTAEGEVDLAPVLADFGQNVDVIPDESGETTALGHVLKVFLVDAQGDVRNVYSAGFLDHRLLLRDVETLRFAE
jgi:cytochrome oxidase Cu insertion factor (SCO1/SenC/PrrC family)